MRYIKRQAEDKASNNLFYGGGHRENKGKRREHGKDQRRKKAGHPDLKHSFFIHRGFVSAEYSSKETCDGRRDNLRNPQGRRGRAVWIEHRINALRGNSDENALSDNHCKSVNEDGRGYQFNVRGSQKGISKSHGERNEQEHAGNV